MGLFQRFEKKVEGAVNGVFARAFKGDVQPVEITARLQRELDAEAKLLSHDKRLVPNAFVVGLSPHDHDKLTPYSQTLTDELSGQLRAHAAAMGYVFSGPVRIHLDLDSRLPTGRFTVASEVAAGLPQADAGRSEARQSQVRPTAVRAGEVTQTDTRPTGVAASRADARAQLVLEVNGMRHPLRPPGLLIGRGSEADLRIDDPGISRRHAQITVRGAEPALELEIVDLGSTNGIVVNGRRVRHSQLQAGSRIEIGSTRMLVHAPAGR